jgi:hypothetical protein
MLLLRFPAAACSGVVERGGAACVQYFAGGAGVVELGQAGRYEDVWEVAGDWASLSV